MQRFSFRSHGAGLAVAFALVALPRIAGATTWEIDSSHSQFGFTVRHLMITDVHGDFRKFSGKIETDDKDPTKSKVDIVVETASINTADEKRDVHLKSAEFFDVEKFPKMTFKSTKITKLGEAKYEIVGDLTIKDTTKPVTLTSDGPGKQIKDPWGNTRSAAAVTGTINRKDFKLTWNKPLEGGGVVVGDDIKLNISLELIKK